jgi:H+/Cl- antiporter ClcA
MFIRLLPTATTRRVETALSYLWVWFLVIVVAILAGLYLELIDTVWLWWHEHPPDIHR